MCSQAYSAICVKKPASEWQCFPAALFSLEAGSTTAKRPRRHPTWRRAVPVWRNRTRPHRRFDAHEGPDPSQALPGESFSMAPKRKRPSSGVLILTTGRTDQIAHDLMLADLRLWVKNGNIRARAAGPFYPQKQTSSACPGMSVRCHHRTHAPQQISSFIRSLRRREPPASGEQ
jgi:hypothetical protein